MASPSHPHSASAHLVGIAGVQGDVGCRVGHPPEDLSPRPAQQQEGRRSSGDAEAPGATPGQAHVLPIGQDISWKRGAGDGGATQGRAGLMRVGRSAWQDKAARREGPCVGAGGGPHVTVGCLHRVTPGKSPIPPEHLRTTLSTRLVFGVCAQEQTQGCGPGYVLGPVRPFATVCLAFPPQDEAKGALENFPRTVCLLQRGEGEGNRGVRSAAGIGGWFGAREPRGSVDEGAWQSQSPQAEAQFQEATRA